MKPKRVILSMPILLLALLGGAAWWALRVSDRPDASMESPAVLLTGGAAAIPETIDYNRDVRPILSDNCFACHGPDDKQRAEGLRLDVREEAVAHGAFVPGHVSESELVKRITSTLAGYRMPPADTNKHLDARQIAILKKWVAQGVVYKPHWAFVKPVAADPPEARDADWCRNGIDRFVLAKLQAKGWKPSPQADRRTLIRRVCLDLTGLPPTEEQIEQFLADDSADAYEKLVDRLLASPQYGERWAQQWLDLARYADTQGYEKDNPRTIWPYRDWVIDAFNADLPFDQFTIHQIAGDLLDEPNRQQLLATAFHRNTMTNTEGGTDDEEFRTAAVVDRVNTTMSVWMGLTASCAQCHTHKYDPITQREYYRLYAFFNQTQDADRDNEHPTLRITTPEQEKELAQRKQKVDTLTERVRKLKEAGDAEALKASEKELKQATGEHRDYERKIPMVPIMRALPEDKRRETRILLRGDFLNPGEAVQPGVPRALHAMPENLPRNRLGLAKWLIHPDNPLTARVQVNRYWQSFFGQGLVATVEDFGMQGDLPTHPELLDWLALEFQRRNWSMKQLCKLIVTSATYRQSSRITPERLESDPYNRLLARGPRFRLSAETLRDQALFVSGLLNDTPGGPSVLPVQPKNTLVPQAFSNYVPKISTGEDRYRRGLYTFWRRTGHYPSFAAFDAPSREVCVIQRSRTNTPLQAMVMLNDPVYIEAAQALARRMIEAADSPEVRIQQAYRWCLSRPPQFDELNALMDLYRRAHRRYAEDTEAAKKMASDPIGELPDEIDPADAAAWTVVANVLLNLDELLVKG